MTLQKTTLWLMVLAVLTLAGVGYVFYSGREFQAPITGAGEKAFPDLAAKAGSIDKISFSGPAGTATLAKTPDGWVVTERGDFPADQALVADLIAGLGEAAKFEPRTAEEKYFSRLGLVEDFVTISVFSGDGLLGELKTGDQFYSPTGEGVLTFALDQASGRAWTYSGLPEISNDPAFWITDGLLFLSDLRLKSLEVVIGDNPPWRIVRADPMANDFILQGTSPALVDQPLVNRAGLAATNMVFDDVFDKSGQNLFKIATARFETFDGLSVSMEFFESEEVILTGLEAAYDESVLTAPETPAVLPDAPVDGAAEAERFNRLWQGRIFQIPLQKLAEILKFRNEFLKDRAPEKNSSGSNPEP